MLGNWQQIAFGCLCVFTWGRIATCFHTIKLRPTREYRLTILPTQINEDISRQLSIVKILLSGEGDTEPNPDAVAQVANEVYAQDLLSLMVVHLGKFDFEVCQSYYDPRALYFYSGVHTTPRLFHTDMRGMVFASCIADVSTG